MIYRDAMLSDAVKYTCLPPGSRTFRVVVGREGVAPAFKVSIYGECLSGTYVEALHSIKETLVEATS